MKVTTLIAALSSILLLGCQKKEAPTFAPDRSLIDAAKSFFIQSYGEESEPAVKPEGMGEIKNPRLTRLRVIDWSKAFTYFDGKTTVVIVPVRFTPDFYFRSNFGGKSIYSASDITKLCLSQDSSGHFQSSLLSFYPDSSYTPGSPFCGIAFVDDWNGNPIVRYKFNKNGQILGWNASKGLGIHSNPTEAPTMFIQAVCYDIIGYNFSMENTEEIYYWSEPAGCSISYSAGGSGGGGGGISSGGVGSVGGGAGGRGGAGISPVRTVIVRSGNNIIGNVIDYNKCFSNIAGQGHTYQVTVCVSQPVPGSRTPWGLSLSGLAGSSAGANPINVGHTFLIFSETSGTGTVKRNIGFYPSGAVTPIDPADAGQLNNDDQHNYNISLTVTLTNGAFFNMLNFIAENSNTVYNLNSFNCTTFALKTLYSGGVVLPSTTGQWAGGGGNDPGDLGEDIRSIALSSNMTRNINPASHPNLGNCN